MRVIAFLFVLVSLSSASDPTPIPADRQEEISRAMIALQQKQLAAVSAITQQQAAEAQFLAMLDALRKEFHAESCPGTDVKPDLTLDKKWSCPPAPAK